MNSAATPISDARRAALRAAKLAGLVAHQWGPGEREPLAFPPGAALSGMSADGDRTVWVLAEDDPARMLGPALIWAERHGADALHMLAGGTPDAGTTTPDPIATLARQAGLFDAPRPAVWRVDGTALSPVEASPPPRHAEVVAPAHLIDLLIDAELEIVVEGGLVRGEINGLEVARIVHRQTTAGVPIDEPLLEVGVGKADRELTAMVHAGLDPVGQLERVIEIVHEHRRPGAPRHPLNQLVPERWLRAVLCRAPDTIGLRSLRPAEGVRPRPNLADRDVAIATGASTNGSPVVVACSVGIALDLVPTAADAREVLDPAAGLVLALPERDDHPGTRRLAARLTHPAAVAPVTGDWRSL